MSTTTHARRALALVVALLSLAGLTMCSAPGGALRISNGQLVDGRGRAIVLRGINYPYGWYAWRNDTAQQFEAMKAMGANSVRVVLNAGRYGTPTTPDEVSAAVSLCQANKLLCILEVHDTTGYEGQPTTGQNPRTLEQAAAYFTSIKDRIAGLESFVIVNIGNEPYGNVPEVQGRWAPDTIGAIRQLRAAGITHTLMVDAPRWGQDDQGTMRDAAPSVWQVDQNVIFSVHMYQVYAPGNPQKIADYLSAYTTRGLPVVVGEFGPTNGPGTAVDVDTILSYTQTHGIGWLAWSWSGNSDATSGLDMVTNFNPAVRSPWGTKLATDANGLRTGREAAVFQP